MLVFLTSLFSSLGLLGEMSLTAAYAALIVMVLRLLLKKRAPRQVVCLLWLVVFARLLIPVSLESPLSIVPNAIAGQEQLPMVEGTAPVPENGPTVPVQMGEGQPGPVLAVPDGAAPAVPLPEAEGGFSWQAAVAGVWLTGAAVIGGAGLVSYLRLRRRLFDAIRGEDGAWEHPAVDSPFILGLFRPKIYLPIGLVGRPREFILCHERAHLRRLDHIVKPVCWIALALHWFNPFVWAAYLLMSRDIEAACDEAVIRRLGSGVKADYSRTLLALATGGRIPMPSPLAFDEGDAKGRIKNVLSYRRPALWIIVVSVLAVGLAAVCLLTDPVNANPPDDSPDASASPSQYPDENGILDPWMRDVLSGEGTFSVGGDTLDLGRLAQAFYGDYPDAPAVALSRFAVIDLDRDGVDELVLWPSIDGDDAVEAVSNVGYLILRRQGDEVLAYQPGFRTFAYLKQDGTFNWSGSAFEWGYGVMRFTEDGFEVDNVTWCELPDNEENRYFVDRLRAEEEEFFAAVQAQNEKPEVQWYLYHYQNPMAEQIALPIPLDEEALAAPVPDFLGTEQQQLYRQALALYCRVFGANTEEVDSWPGELGYDFTQDDIVEQDGMFYTPATGRYARWDDFEEAVLSVFTPRLWAQRNSWGGTVPTYADIGGRLYYIAGARGSYGYNDNFPPTFQLARRTEDEISFVMTGYYSEPYPREGESFEERDARLAADYEYTIDFPLRLVKTANGWRFDEFYCAYTDNAVPPFSDQKVPNMRTTQPAGEEPESGWLLAATQQREKEWGSDYIELRQKGDNLTLSFSGVSYPITEDASVNEAGQYLIDMMCMDFDGDGDTEALLTYHNYNRGGQMIAVLYDRPGAQLIRSELDTNELVAAFEQNTVAAYNRDSRVLTLTYSHSKGHMDDPDYDRRFITGSCVLPEDFFAGREELQDANLCPWMFSGGLHATMDYNDPARVTCKLAYDLYFYLADDSLRGEFVRTEQAAEHMVEKWVGSMNFDVEYDGTGFTVTPAEEFDLEYPQP